MPELARYEPHLPAPVQDGASVSGLLLNLLAALILPEVVIPATMASYASSLATPDRLNVSLAIASNFTGTVKNTLEIIKLARDLGWIGSNSNDDLKRIANALYVKENNVDISISDLLKRVSSYTPESGSNSGQRVDLAQVLYNQYTTLYVDVPNVGKIPLTDALARGLFTGYFRFYDQIPLNGENGG